MNRRHLPPLVALLVPLAVACGDAGEPPPLGQPSDAGIGGDQGVGPTDQGTVPDACGLPIVVGPCEAAIRRYAFDTEAGRCVPFTYGGCGGNANNFESLAACQAVCPGGPAVCGTRGGDRCADGEYCDFGGDHCGETDRGGLCRPRPEACYDVYAPVCGCDEQTYGNDCEAAAAGVSVRYEGACESTARACGGWSGHSCDADEFCRYENEGCDWADAQGVCQERPEACTRVYAPVCGCNGQTFANRCLARVAGFDAAHAGPCEPSGSGNCADNSVDALLLGGQYSFGFCEGDCGYELRVFPTDAASPLECDGVELLIGDAWRPGGGIRNRGTLTPAGHMAVRAAARALVGTELRPSYGCPDCDDGGATTLWLRRPVGPMLPAYEELEVVYETGNPPAILRSADELLEALIRTLLSCQSSPYASPVQGCEPRG